MRTMKHILFFTLLALQAARAIQAAPLSLTLAQDEANPANPTMGDQLHFHSVITNSADKPIEGLVAWISLVEVTLGHEQPMDLEDWSALKAVTGANLTPGASVETDWPMRLIQHGDYRVVISGTARNQRTVYTSPTVEFHVTRKPMVQSSRILPVAIGVPLLLLGWMIVGRRRVRVHRTSGSRT